MIKELSNQLKTIFQGKLVFPGDTEYDTVRKVFNGMIDKHPAAFAYCKTVQDVITCVNFARDNNVLLAIRAGGHNAGGLGIADDALVIDLSLMREIKVDTASKTVMAQGGCLLKDMDIATHEVGMTVPSGIFGTTGVAGLTLGGGLGNLTRALGLSIDHLLAAEVVLANGKLVNASANENPDLFWAIRGGGGNFGVVVSFTFRLSPIHTVYAGPMLWELEDSEEMMTWHHEFMQKAPNELSGYFAFLTVPPVAPFPEHLHLRKMCGVVWCYAGDMDKAEDIFKPIRAKKNASLDFVGPMPVPVLQTLFDSLYPPGLLWYWKADYIKDLSAETIKLHVKFANQLPTPFSTMHMYNINGAAAKVSKQETAWNFRDATYAMVIVGISDNVNDKEKITTWAKDYWSAIHPHSMGGAYVNMMMEEGEERVKASYGENYKRLSEVKAQYDPGNLFRVNQNIKPA